MPQPPVCADGSPNNVMMTMHSASAPPLSPRQKLQSQIRDLQTSPTTKLRAQTRGEERNARQGQGLHHVSSLRVQPETRYIKARETDTQYDCPERLSEVATNSEPLPEPDFVKEERAAWSKRSPSAGIRPTHKLQESPSVPILQPTPHNTGPIPQPRKQAKQKVAFRSFAPLNKEVDTDDRPKTRHGLALSLQEQSDKANETGAETTSSGSKHRDRELKRSKFLEGSMNERSIAVASTWQTDATDSVADIDSESDSQDTPRPSKAELDNASIDTELETPATTKRRFFNFRSKTKSSGDQPEQKASSPKRLRKGLRKSLSIWNFNSEDKVKSTDESSTIATPKPLSKAIKQTPLKVEKKVLNDRKRKAEEAYAQQFGLKKRKSNLDLVTSNSTGSIATLSPAEKRRVKNRRSISGGHTFTPGSSTSHSRAQSEPDPIPIYEEHPSSDTSRNSIDHRKRPSRRDLEKENQQLREMLRRSQSQTFAQSISVQVAQEIVKQRETVVSVSPQKNTDHVPALPTRSPSRPVLGEIRNGTPTGHLQPQPLSLRKSTRTMKGQPVSTILEEDERPLAGGHAKGATTEERSGRGENWEWPEDVF